MNISKRLFDMMIEQVGMEYDAAFSYLNMSNALSITKLRGATKWLFEQYKEEVEHANVLISFLHDNFHFSVNYAVSNRQNAYLNDTRESPLLLFSIFSDAYTGEQELSTFVDEICKVAIEESNFAVYNFMQWFVKEQLEEEASLLKCVDMVECVIEGSLSMYDFDKELSERT